MVLIGVHTTNGGEKMAGFVKEQGISYPVAIDRGTTAKSFRVDSYPDYYLIDRAGNLRVADLKNGDLERAVKVLLAEKGAKAKPKLADMDAAKVLNASVESARGSDRKVIVHIGGPG